MDTLTLQTSGLTSNTMINSSHQTVVEIYEIETDIVQVYYRSAEKQKHTMQLWLILGGHPSRY